MRFRFFSLLPPIANSLPRRPSHVAASTLASSSSAGRAAEYAARTTENVESAASTSYTPYPVPSASSAGPPSLAAINAAAAASAPAPSPSPASLPGPSLSSSFAPPAPKARKPRTSSSASKPPRRTADGVLKGRGTSEVYVPPPVQPRTGDSSRPQRKRKLPTHLTFEQSSDPVDEEYEEENELATKKAKGKGKGKAKALPPPPPIDPEEIDELASDYEEELERRSSMSIDRGSATPAASVQEEEEDGRFPIGTAVMAKVRCSFPSLLFPPSKSRLPCVLSSFAPFLSPSSLLPVVPSELTSFYHSSRTTPSSPPSSSTPVPPLQPRKASASKALTSSNPSQPAPTTVGSQQKRSTSALSRRKNGRRSLRIITRRSRRRVGSFGGMRWLRRCCCRKIRKRAFLSSPSFIHSLSRTDPSSFPTTA